jgi:hypothetical protein
VKLAANEYLSRMRQPLRVRGLNSELGFQFGNHCSEHLLGSGIALAQIVVKELAVELLRPEDYRPILLDAPTARFEFY